MSAKLRPANPCALRDARAITIVKRDNIGDFILAKPFLDAACAAWPEKEITLICFPQVEPLANLFYPRWKTRVIDDKNAYRGISFLPSKLKRELARWPVADCLISLRAYRYPREITFDSWIPARAKIALRNQCYVRLLPDELAYDEIIESTAPVTPEISREILNHQALATHCFGTSVPLPSLPSFSSLSSLPPLPAAYIVVSPFGSAPIRDYPIPALAEALKAIHAKHKLPLVITSVEKDTARAETLRALCGSATQTISLAGKLTLPQFLALIQKSAAVISMETATAHAAVASGIPAVVFLGGGHYGLFAPWGDPAKVRWLHQRMDCYDCQWNCRYDHARCIHEIPWQAAVDAFDAVFLNSSHS